MEILQKICLEFAQCHTFNKNIPVRNPIKLSDCGGAYQVCHYGDFHIISSTCCNERWTGKCCNAELRITTSLFFDKNTGLPQLQKLCIKYKLFYLDSH